MVKISIDVLWLWVRRLFAVAVLGVVTWSSLTDTDGLRAHEMAHFLAHLHRMTGFAMDKIAHFLMYFGVCGALWSAFPSRVKGLPSVVAAFIGANLWGFLMECVQGIETLFGLGQRRFDLWDMVANGCGAMVAMGVILLMCSLWRVFRQKWARRSA